MSLLKAKSLTRLGTLLVTTGLLTLLFVKGQSASCAPVPSVKDQKLKSVEELVGKLVEAFGKKDIDAIVEMSEVPWYNQSGWTTKTKDEVRKELKSGLDEKLKFEPKFKITWMKSYKTARPEFTENQTELIDTVLADDDFVVAIEIERKVRNLKAGLLIKMKDGKPRFVGNANVD